MTNICNHKRFRTKRKEHLKFIQKICQFIKWTEVLNKYHMVNVHMNKIFNIVFHEGIAN